MSLLITVCVPTYNRANYIGRALRSLIDQSIDKKLYEIIVVDDGSNDNTNLVLKSFSADIKLLKNKKNIGLSKSLNKALDVSRGRYFLRVDSDDYVSYEYLNFLFNILNSNKDEYNAACCDYFLVDDKEKILKRCNSIKEPIGCGILFKIEDLLLAGKYSENIKIYEEIDLIKKLKKKINNFKIIRLPVPLYRYKFHKKNMTTAKLLKKIKK